MNYFQKMNELLKEAFTFKQYKRLNIVVRIIVFILMLPLFISALFSAGLYYLSAVGYKFAVMPLEVLKDFLHKEVKEKHFLPQTAIILVCLPFVFSLQVMAAFIALGLGFSYFGITVMLYIQTLTGITFKPFILDEVERDYSTDYKKLGLKGTLYLLIMLVCVLVFMLCTGTKTTAFALVLAYLAIIGLPATMILYPIFNFKLEKEEAPVEEKEE